jgi:hypothetical protein
MSVFRTFRCKCFKVKYGKIKKFTFRVTQCIYLVPAAGGDGYHLYNETTKHMISSHDVVFYENNFKVSNEHTTIAIFSYVDRRNQILSLWTTVPALSQMILKTI